MTFSLTFLLVAATFLIYAEARWFFKRRKYAKMLNRWEKENAELLQQYKQQLEMTPNRPLQGQEIEIG